jgi:anthranilate/para-aminobenzoate synthase component II
VGGEGEIMGLRWRRGKALDGVQFHPESFLTPDGTALLANFLASRASMEVASQGMSASRPH